MANALKFYNICLMVGCALAIPTSLSRTGQFFPDALDGVLNTGAVYLQNYKRLTAGNAYVWVEYIRIILAFLTSALVPLLIYLWHHLGATQRVGGLLIIAFQILMYLAIGTNKGIADLLITVPFIITVAAWAESRPSVIFKRNYLLLFTIGFILFFCFFAMGQFNRVGVVGSEGVLPTGEFLLQANRHEDGYASWMPRPLMIFYESLTRYLGQGYYALSMSFSLETPTTYGVGHSMFLSRNADALASTTYFTDNTIPYVLETERHWNRLGLWHSIYPWIASDVGFSGALAVMGGASALLAYSWRLALHRQGIIGIVLLQLMLIMFFYIPANNQIFQSGETAAAVAFAMIGMLIGADRYFTRPVQ